VLDPAVPLRRPCYRTARVAIPLAAPSPGLCHVMLDVLVLLAVLPPWLILSPVVMENEIKYEVVFISPPVHITNWW